MFSFSEPAGLAATLMFLFILLKLKPLENGVSKNQNYSNNQNFICIFLHVYSLYINSLKQCKYF